MVHLSTPGTGKPRCLASSRDKHTLKLVNNRQALNLKGKSSRRPDKARYSITRQAGDVTTVQQKAASDSQAAEPAVLVDQILELIESTENGEKASAQQKEQIDGLINQLETIGQRQDPRPLDSPLVYGNYDVAYVSTGKSQQGQPAGGRFRTGVGKVLFKTTVLAQSVLEPDLVINKVGFALLGVLRGAVGLRGRLVSIPEEKGGVDNRDTVKVFFQPPVLSLGTSVHTRIGPPSSVVLKTTYLDDRVRLGRGSRGSLFVFTRGGKADQAGMDQVGLERSTPLGLVLLGALLSGLILGGGYAATRPLLPNPARAAGIVSALLGLALVAVFWRGGQFNENTDRSEVARPDADAGEKAA